MLESDNLPTCPNCQNIGIVKRGLARGIQRYLCKGCGRTFQRMLRKSHKKFRGIKRICGYCGSSKTSTGKKIRGDRTYMYKNWLRWNEVMGV
jgi:transposase-like protein